MLSIPTEDTKPKATHNILCPNVPADVPEELKPFYFGSLHVDNYHNIKRDLTLYVYKNLPDPVDGNIFINIDFYPDVDYYIKNEVYIIECITIQQLFIKTFPDAIKGDNVKQELITDINISKYSEFYKTYNINGVDINIYKFLGGVEQVPYIDLHSMDFTFNGKYLFILREAYKTKISFLKLEAALSEMGLNTYD